MKTLGLSLVKHYIQMLPSEFRRIMSNYNNVFQSNSNTLLG